MEITETPTQGSSPEKNAFQQAESALSQHYEGTIPDTRTPAYAALLHQVALDKLEDILQRSILASQLRDRILQGSRTDENVEARVEADMEEIKDRKAVEELRRTIDSHAGRDVGYAQEVSTITGLRKSLAEGYTKANMIGYPSGEDAAKTVLAKTLTQVKSRPTTMTAPKL